MRKPNPPEEEKGPEQNPAVRLIDLDMTRCVEGCAIEMAKSAGTGIEYKPGVSATTKQWPRIASLERDAMKLMLDSLEKSYCHGSVVLPRREVFWEEREVTVGDNKKEPRCVLESYGMKPAPHKDADDKEISFKLDFVLLPLDGSYELRRGADEAVSALAGGTPGAFQIRPERELLPEHKQEHFQKHVDYLVLALNPRLEKLLRPDDRAQIRLPISISDAIDFLIKGAVSSTQAVGQGTIDFTIGWVPPDKKDPKLSQVAESFAKTISEFSRKGTCRIRTYSGSTVAAAVTAFLPKFGIDVFLALVDETRATLIAAAAACTQCTMFARPVGGPDDNWLTTDSFVDPKKDVFFVATGITEHLLLKGVRFKGDEVSTHTLCFRSGTRSKRFISNDHQLKEKSNIVPPAK